MILITGLILNTVGGAVYSYVKYQEGERKKRQLDKDKHPSLVSLVNQEAKSNGGFRRHHRGSLTGEEPENEEQDQGLWIKNNESKLNFVDERKL